ncbi:MAG: hypothetical protein PUK70_07060 [Bacteroidales bacterium]|nr:hypothetical protein [Bacteroidales bacterium]MDY6001420.1 hypothetical protein [Candidatus Cryptobacteroides sp.]
MKKFHYRLRRFCAFLIGATLVVAGVFKLMDPVGTGLIMEDYFKFFHIQFLDPAAKVLGTLLAVFETIVGSALMTGVWRRITAIVTSAMVAFFTILTLILAIFNPPMDCGCFGEVVHLTNLQTFFKNLVLLALAGIAFLPINEYGDAKKLKYIAFWLSAASMAGFAIYSWLTIPMVDYTAFKPGSELYASMDNPSEAYDDMETKVIYEKNGQEGAFPLDKLPDSTWTYVRTETVRINDVEKNEAFPKLSFTDAEGNYHDELATEGDVIICSAYKPEKLKREAWARMADVIETANGSGYVPIVLVSCSHEAFDSLSAMTSELRARLKKYAYLADFKMLTSVNRANGGYTIFNDGELIRKYSARWNPSSSELLDMTDTDPSEEMLHYSTNGRLHLQMFFLYLFIVLVLI